MGAGTQEELWKMVFDDDDDDDDMVSDSLNIVKTFQLLQTKNENGKDKK